MPILAAATLVIELGLIILTRYLSIVHRQNLFREHTFFTLFSALQIAFVSLTALVVAGLTYRMAGRRTVRMYAWLLTAVYAAYLAADELAELHERVAQFSGRVFKLLHVPLKSSYWDGPFFLLYFGMAALLWVLLKSDLMAEPLARHYIRVAGTFLIIGVILDLGLAGILLVIWEDSFKLLGFMFLWLTFLAVTVRKLAQIESR